MLLFYKLFSFSTRTPNRWREDNNSNIFYLKWEKQVLALAACVWPEPGLRPSASVLTFWPRLTLPPHRCASLHEQPCFPNVGWSYYGPLGIRQILPGIRFPHSRMISCSGIQETLQIVPARIRSCRSLSDMSRGLICGAISPYAAAPINIIGHHKALPRDNAHLWHSGTLGLDTRSGATLVGIILCSFRFSFIYFIGPFLARRKIFKNFIYIQNYSRRACSQNTKNQQFPMDCTRIGSAYSCFLPKLA